MAKSKTARRAKVIRQRHDPYERALTAAVKRLEKAQDEQNKCRVKLSALNLEIPRLQGIIAVLQPKAEPVPHAGWPGVPQSPLRIGPRVVAPTDVDKLTPEDLKALAPPINLSGVGSIPAGSPDDENLPEPEGVPVIEEL